MIEIVKKYLPSDWDYRNLNEGIDKYLINIPSNTGSYSRIKFQTSGSFNKMTEKIMRVENNYLYAQYLLKKSEYERRGCAKVMELYHDTAQDNIPSIVKSNLDRRKARRVKFGKGVSFSPSPEYANSVSSRYNGINRAMIVADVLVGETENVYSPVDLPSAGYDTTVGNAGNVYVKFYDNEFYPKYVVYYKNC